MPPARRAGYSLVEMMVVLVIFGIMLAVAIPNIQRSNRARRAEAAAQEMSSRIQIARQRTIASRMPFRVVLDPAGGTYHTERSTSDSTWTADPDLNFTIPEGVLWRFTAGGDDQNTEIEFRGDGSILAEDSPLLVTFTAAGQDSFTLSLVRTGRLVVRRGGP